MADYGSNYAYGASYYKDEGWEGGGEITTPAPEPVVLVKHENRCFFFSHRTNAFGEREYRFTEFLKRGTYRDSFVVGTL